MKSFVFRNNTIERFFGADGVEYSGYDDVSQVPDADEYVWFYQVPFKYDTAALAAEVATYPEKLALVLSRVPEGRTFFAFTLVDLYGLCSVRGDFSLRRAVSDFNAQLFALAEQQPNIKVVRTEDFLSNYKREEWTDWKYYFISQAALNPRLAGDFRKWFARRKAEVAGVRKKCLVLDLDNTLWGGVLGEDGPEGILIGGDYPGKAFLYFQEAIAQLGREGIILTICSKNNEADVEEAWAKNPYIVLKADQIAARRINWQDKATNLRELAAELNIGLDSFVFVDDNPTERELIRQMLPEVAVPDFPAQPYELPAFFKSLVDNYFAAYQLTSEDLKKTAQYKANAQRAGEQRKFANFDDYLRSLDIAIDIQAADAFNIPRIAQMSQKTNQFNLTTRRYTEADIHALLDDGCSVWCFGVSDRFGDSGITGELIARISGAKADIDTLLLSCRILGKGIEEAFLFSLLNLLRSRGVSEVSATYIPTLKNGQTRDFFERMGFTCVEELPNGEKHYRRALDSEIEIKPFYKITLK